MSTSLVEPVRDYRKIQTVSWPTWQVPKISHEDSTRATQKKNNPKTRKNTVVYP